MMPLHLFEEPKLVMADSVQQCCHLAALQGDVEDFLRALCGSNHSQCASLPMGWGNVISTSNPQGSLTL